MGAPDASTWQSGVHGTSVPFVSGHMPPGATEPVNTTAAPVLAVGKYDAGAHTVAPVPAMVNAYR